MVSCTGRGNNGDHCCYIDGEVCHLLDTSGEVPRCSVWGNWDAEPYLSSPAAVFYEREWPGMGYTCADWPQNIPEVMAAAPTAGPFYVCCWGRGNRGDVG